MVEVRDANWGAEHKPDARDSGWRWFWTGFGFAFFVIALITAVLQDVGLF